MSKIDPNKPLPQIHNRELVAKTNIFRVERVDLEFSNGATRQFERVPGSGRGAVLIVAVTEQNEVLIVREYSAGTHAYELGFPKGHIDPGENAIQAANRELMEEAGKGAHTLTEIHSLAMAPNIYSSMMKVVIAQDLYDKSLPGDEPEPLDVIKWPLDKADELIARSDFTEARSVAALFLAQKWLSNGGANEN